MESLKKVVVLGGGTVSYIRSHFAISAPAYGKTAETLSEMCRFHSDRLDVQLVLTKMADPQSKLETYDDIERFVMRLVKDDLVKILFFNVALVDFSASVLVGGEETDSGKYEERLSSRSVPPKLLLTPHPKLIKLIRETRKDIFLVGFKTTCGVFPHEQYLAGLALLKESSCNLVLANDTLTRNNMVITPEESVYHETTNRAEALHGLVEMAYLRSHLTFTRSTVIAGESVDWSSRLVPDSLRAVVNFCIDQGAYKPFMGATVGHFAAKIGDTTFITSKRKTNFNNLASVGLVKIETDGPDSVLAYGSKPSVGGQSQRIVFEKHPEADCIVHAHVPLLRAPRDAIPVVSQREYECGSHECGENTSSGLKKFGNLLCVMLDNHGPNIVFHHDIDPMEVIDFITANFDLSAKTGGYLV